MTEPNYKNNPAINICSICDLEIQADQPIMKTLDSEKKTESIAHESCIYGEVAISRFIEEIIGAEDLRLIEIDRRIRSGEFPNCYSMSRPLNRTVKTISRDIKKLRQKYRAPIEYDRDKNGFYYRDEDFVLELSFEKKKIEVLRKWVKQYSRGAKK